MEWKNSLTRTPYLVLFVVLLSVGVGTASALITITLAGNVIITDDLTVDTDTLFVDSSENKIGIGTLTPSEILDVDGNVAIDGSLDVSNAPIYSHRSPGSPSSNLIIERTGGPTADNVQFTLSHRPTNKDLWIYGFDGTTFKNFVGFDYPNYKITFPSTGNTLVIDGANDKVGIGTGNPSEELEVAGNVKISGNLTVDGNYPHPLVYKNKFTYNDHPPGPGPTVNVGCDSFDVAIGGGITTAFSNDYYLMKSNVESTYQEFYSDYTWDYQWRINNLENTTIDITHWVICLQTNFSGS